ncbi:uncharacterized protein LOC143353579 isoform X2 [Halictus rubicundus]|uniref:uncharacterized protein LOC143353579 isoform X2 n=1 Tax=Halictus rubicundus TaxID=77578 RepID=UPI00403707DC
MNLSRCIYILFPVFVIILSVSCEDENYFENLSDPDDMVDPHSFYYDKHSKKMVDDVGSGIKSKDSTMEYSEIKKERKYEKQVDNYESHEAIFYKRLINLLLLNMNVKEEDDILLVGTLEFEMSHAQMKILQNFQTQKVSLREVDEILSTTIKKPYRNMFDVTEFFNILFRTFVITLRTVENHPDAVILVVVMLMFGLMLRMIKQGRGFPMFIIIQVIFILSFFMTWWHLIQEAEIKSMAEQMKFSNIPISCQPDKMSTWDKFVSFLNFNDDCEKYHQAMMSNPKLKVTPAHALSHLLTTVILNPIVHMGTVVSGFINNATDGLPWFYGWMVKLMLFFSIAIVIILSPICLSGASINLGVGPLLRFGIDYHRNHRKGNSIQYENKRQPVQDIVPQVMYCSLKTPAIAAAPVAEQLKQIESSEAKVQTDNSLKESDTRKEDKDLSGGDSRKIIEFLKNDVEESKQCDKISETVTVKHDGSGDN